mgnify:CR=1 FL=1
MKALIFVFYLSFINYICSDQCDKFTNIPSQVSDCQDKLSQSQIDDDKKAYCCYSKDDTHINPQCISLTQEQYDKIKEYIKYNRILWGEVNLSVDCNSSFISLGLIFSILFFLL